MGTVASGFDPGACLRSAAAVEAGLLQLTASLTEAEFHAPTRIGGWSMGQCIEHLVLTGHAFLPRLDAALKRARPLATNGPRASSYTWWQRQILRAFEDPCRFRSQAASMLVPCGRHSIDETVHRFQAMHHEITRRLEQSQAVDPRRTSVQSPLVSWMHHTIGFSFDVVLAHERRHLRQAWRVRRQLLGEAREIVRYDT